MTMNLESITWNLKSTAWSTESRSVLDYLNLSYMKDFVEYGPNFNQRLSSNRLLFATLNFQ